MVVSIRVITENTKGKLYLTFGGTGVWLKAVENKVGLLYKMSQQCEMLVRLVPSVSQHPDMAFVKEWHSLQRSLQQGEQQQSDEGGTIELKEEDYEGCEEDEDEDVQALKKDLALTKGELRAANERIAFLEERIALRENTLINVLIGSHPAFEGLADYPKRRKRSGDKENKVDFNAAPMVLTYTPHLGPQQKTMSRTLSSTQGKAVRVAASSQASKKKKQIAAPGQTPGARVKTRSRVFA